MHTYVQWHLLWQSITTAEKYVSMAHTEHQHCSSAC